MITAYFDGACEPTNPGGTAAYGAVVYINGVEVWSDSKICKPKKPRETSNNIAEYAGFAAVIGYLQENNLWHEEIEIFGDSKLVIEQMNFRWKIKKGLYKPLALECREIMKKLRKEGVNINLYWIPRDKNDRADELSKSLLIKNGVEFRIQPL